MTAKYRETFTTPYEQYAERKGQAFTVLHVVSAPTPEVAGEVTPMYKIRFDDGSLIDAWPEEVLRNDVQYVLAEVCEHGYDDHIAAMVCDDFAEAWEWLYNHRRAQLDAANVVGDSEDPYDGDDCLRQLNAKVTVAVNRREHDFGDDTIEGDELDGEKFDYKITGEVVFP